MSTKLHRNGLAAVSRFNPDRGQEIFAIPVEPPNAIFGVLWYFAVLGYPASSDLEDRESFAKALHSWRCKNARQYARAWQQLPAEIRSLTNRSIQGKLNMGLKRIDKRLEAGSIAASLYLKDRPVPGINPTTQNGRGTVICSGNIPTVTEGLREVLKQRGQITGWHYDIFEPGVIERDAIENARTYIWNESLPVLHHAVTLHCWLGAFPTGERRFTELYRLIHDPHWLRAALTYAEDWRTLLDREHCVPAFDKNKAIRLIPSD